MFCAGKVYDLPDPACISLFTSIPAIGALLWVVTFRSELNLYQTPQCRSPQDSSYPSARKVSTGPTGLHSGHSSQHCAPVKEKRAEANAPPPPEMPGALKFGPLEQALMVLIIIGMVSDPAATGVPSLLTPGVTMLLIIAYGGYRLLEWQKEAEKRAREQPEKPAESKSASSLAREKGKAAKERETPKANGTQITTKADLLKEQDRLKDKSSKTSRDVRAATKKTQYFLTMNGQYEFCITSATSS
jgi:hypothetical protein